MAARNRSKPKSGSGRYAAGTKVDAERSQFELTRILERYRADDFLLVEDDANATVRFAIHGHRVHFVLPLPDPESAEFTHTASGKPRDRSAQERAYERAVRQQWRSLLLVTRGKLEAVESGISSLEREFPAGGFVLSRSTADRGKPKKNGILSALGARTLLGVSYGAVLSAIGLGIVVPASTAGVYAVPPSVVKKLATPLLGTQPEVMTLGELEGAAGDGTVMLAVGDGPRIRMSPSGQGSDAASVAANGRSQSRPRADGKGDAGTASSAGGGGGPVASGGSVGAGESGGSGGYGESGGYAESGGSGATVGSGGSDGSGGAGGASGSGGGKSNAGGNGKQSNAGGNGGDKSNAGGNGTSNASGNGKSNAGGNGGDKSNAGGNGGDKSGGSGGSAGPGGNGGGNAGGGLGESGRQSPANGNGFGAGGRFGP